MEMLRSLRGDKHEFCLTVMKDLSNMYIYPLSTTLRTHVDRHHYHKSSNIPKTGGGQIHLNVVTVLRSP